MRVEQILDLPSMPLAGPSYPKGPYRFIDREYMIITYETDPDLIRAQLPEPLEPVEKSLAPEFRIFPELGARLCDRSCDPAPHLRWAFDTTAAFVAP